MERKQRFLGAFLSQGEMDIAGSGTDAVGDTMNGGKIYLHGDAGDAAGYAMWGGALYIRGNAGSRAGVHMKATALLLIGGCAGPFLGEYQAGGTIVVLGLGSSEPLPGPSACAGMHGGRIFLRGSIEKSELSAHVAIHAATAEDMRFVMPHLENASQRFGWDLAEVLSIPFTVLTPQTHRPYKTMYTAI